MGDECLLSQQGSRLVVVALHVCVCVGGWERMCKKGEGARCQEIQKMSWKTEGGETKSVTGKNTASISVLIILRLREARFHIFSPQLRLFFAQWKKTAGWGWRGFEATRKIACESDVYSQSCTPLRCFTPGVLGGILIDCYPPLSFEFWVTGCTNPIYSKYWENMSFRGKCWLIQHVII